MKEGGLLAGHSTWKKYRVSKDRVVYRGAENTEQQRLTTEYNSKYGYSPQFFAGSTRYRGGEKCPPVLFCIGISPPPRGTRTAMSGTLFHISLDYISISYFLGCSQCTHSSTLHVEIAARARERRCASQGEKTFVQSSRTIACKAIKMTTIPSSRGNSSVHMTK